MTTPKWRRSSDLKENPSMSQYSGDTARAHRLRKQKINRRAKVRVLKAELEAAKATKEAKKS
jgi:hypothetical protein